MKISRFGRIRLFAMEASAIFMAEIVRGGTASVPGQPRRRAWGGVPAEERESIDSIVTRGAEPGKPLLV
jgi:hypothetical protein